MEERISIDQRIKQKIYEKYHGRCYYCGRPLALSESTMDHVIPLAKGGLNDVNNFVLCCSECNLIKDSKLVDEFRLSLYSIIATALRFLNSGVYNLETGELKFFGEKISDSITNISKEETTRFNRLMKPQSYKKPVVQPTYNKRNNPLTTRLTMEDFRSLEIDNPYDLSTQKIDKPYDDPDWENQSTLVERPFIKLVGEPIYREEEKSEEIFEENDNSEEESNELFEIPEEEIQSSKKPDPYPNFVLLKDERDLADTRVKVVEFNLPKNISKGTRLFLDEIKHLIETKCITGEESLKTYYSLMDTSLFTERTYNQISRELMKKDIINKHKKFRPRAISITYINI